MSGATSPSQTATAPDSDLAGATRGLPSIDTIWQQRRAATAPAIQSMKADQTKVADLEEKEAARPDLAATPAPTAPAPDPVRGFASAASVFAMVASAFTHTPAVAAMSSLAESINARNKNDMAAYEKHFQEWKTQTDEALKIDAAHREKVGEALELMKTHAAEGQAMLNATDAEYRDEQGAVLSLAGLSIQRAQLQDSRARLAMEMEKTKGEMEEQQPKIIAAHALAEAMHGNDPQKLAEAQHAYAFAVNPTAAMGGNSPVGVALQRYMAQYPNATGEDIQRFVTGFKPQSASAAKEQRADTIAADAFKQAHGRDPGPGDQVEMARLTDKAVTESGAGDPASIDQTAKMIAGYQMQPLTAFAMRSPWGQQVMAKVGQMNPDYQAARYPEISRAMTAFSSGRQGDVVRSMNVAISHLDSIDELGDALKNGNLPAVNSIGQKLSQELGVAAPVTFDAAKQIVADEVVKAIVGYTGAANDRESMQEKLNRANSPEALEAVTHEFRTLMAGQLRGMRNQYEDATGFKTGPFSFNAKLLPETQRELENVDAKHGGGRSAAAPPQIGEVHDGYRFKGGNPADQSSWQKVAP